MQLLLSEKYVEALSSHHDLAGEKTVIVNATSNSFNAEFLNPTTNAFF